MTYQDELRLEQYKTLRVEIERHDQNRARIQYASLFTSAVSVVWVLDQGTNGNRVHPLEMILLTLIPLAILLAGRHIAASHVRRSKTVGNFIREHIEPSLPDGERWEAYLRPEDRKNDGEVTNPTEDVFLIAAAVEAILIFVTLVPQLSW